ncbi:lycopene cyclase family protein, partial [Acinetobacter baumannii]
RGLEPGLPLALGYQKFYGAQIETEVPHGEPHPVIMDATVPQIDGYRFVYTLPFDGSTILIEDTYYSDSSEVDASRLRQRVAEYAAAKGWTIKR